MATSSFGDTPVGSLPAAPTKYDFNQRMFPSDLGSNGSYNNHWLVININVQNDSQFNQGSKYYNIVDGVYSKSDTLRFEQNGNNVPNDVLGATAAGNPFNRPRFTKRIKESIALYMPNSEVTYSDNHEFQNISLTKFAAGVGTGAAALIGGGIGALAGGLAGGTMAVNAINRGAEAAGALIGNISGTIFNRPINPRVELLFSNTFQREFTFDFMFAPSSEEESISLKEIIKTLRFHAAPEAHGVEGAAQSPDLISAWSNLGPAIAAAADSFFWVPPSEFDISFYHNGSENTKIPRINTCVLKSIDVSYAPAGTYATFSNGYPVQTRMVLRFTEVEVTHKKRVLQGF